MATIAEFHACSRPTVFVVTGGGVKTISELLRVPGASASVLEAVVPYSAAALREFLKRTPEKYCAPETALMMAARAYERARELAGHAAENGHNLLGLACTAALVSNVPKRGPHRCHIAAHSARESLAVSLELNKGARDRAAEDDLVSDLLLAVLYRAVGLLPADDALHIPALRDDEQVTLTSATGDPLLVELIEKRRSVVWRHPDGTCSPASREEVRGVLCGSFNPLHRGHTALRAVAERFLGGPVCYELSVQNADKPPLDYVTLAGRLARFDEHAVALTSAATFAAKCRALPGVTLVVGVDTACRIVDPVYYGGEEGLESAMNELRQSGNRFLTAARVMDGKLTELADLHIPARFADLFDAIPASEFRVDVSSTALRNQG